MAKRKTKRARKRGVPPDVPGYVIGDSLRELKKLPDQWAQMCVTSPPYWGLRDYDVQGQQGLEETPQAYVRRLVRVMREVRRVLRKDGVLFLNLGDSYIGARCGGQGPGGCLAGRAVAKQRANVTPTKRAPGLKYKDLVGIPWRVAFALQKDGWWLRNDNIWAKPDPIPESVKDRCTRSHEYVFLLSKSRRYFYDAVAIREQGNRDGFKGRMGASFHVTPSRSGGERWKAGSGRNKRDVWTIQSQPYPGAHFAVFPPKLAETCILAGSRMGDIVLDPYIGSGTTGMVAEVLGRRWFGIDLDPGNAALIEERTKQAGLFGRALLGDPREEEHGDDERQGESAEADRQQALWG